jgi:hypothetical protein
MGGFTLIGPSYTFRSLPSERRCRCRGYSANISKDIENIMINQQKHVLDLTIFPDDVRSTMLRHHLGDNFNYKVTKTITKEEKEAQDKQWFEDMSEIKDNTCSKIIYTNNGTSQVDRMFETISIDNETNLDKKLEDLIAERNNTMIQAQQSQLVFN